MSNSQISNKQYENLINMIHGQFCEITTLEQFDSIRIRYQIDRGNYESVDKDGNVVEHLNIPDNTNPRTVKKFEEGIIFISYSQKYNLYQSYLDDCFEEFKKELNRNILLFPQREITLDYLNNIFIEFEDMKIGETLNLETINSNPTSPELITDKTELLRFYDPICIYEINIKQITHFLEYLKDKFKWLKDLTFIQDNKVSNKADERLIIFKDDETINKIYELLKSYFVRYEDELLLALKGKKLSRPLLFPHNQNKLVEFFKRVHYNNFILSNKVEINNWLIQNFEYNSKRGAISIVKKFNADTITGILSRNKGEPEKEARICWKGIDWLPYKHVDKR